jgi:hypothetical protein
VVKGWTLGGGFSNHKEFCAAEANSGLALAEGKSTSISYGGKEKQFHAMWKKKLTR